MPINANFAHKTIDSHVAKSRVSRLKKAASLESEAPAPMTEESVKEEDKRSNGKR